jgi:hypothetical protein
MKSICNPKNMPLYACFKYFYKITVLCVIQPQFVTLGLHYTYSSTSEIKLSFRHITISLDAIKTKILAYCRLISYPTSCNSH